jgi:alanyl aminopeptidase
LRQSLVPLLATYGQDEVLASQARQLADAWLAGQASPDANLLGSILRAAAFNGDKALHARYLAKLEGTTDKANRSRILGALSDFRDPAALHAGMDILASGKIPFIEASGLLFAGQTFPETRRLAFDFLKVNFDTIVKLMPTGGGFDFGSVLPDVGSSFCDIKSRNELESFFTPKVAQFTGAPNALKQTLETIDLCIASKAAQQPGFDKFLEKY